MVAGFDTSFFVKLVRGNERCKHALAQIAEGKAQGVTSSLVVYELERLFIKGKIRRDLYEGLTEAMETLIQVVPLDSFLARLSARVACGTGLHTSDAIIYTTCKEAGCDVFYTGDRHFEAVSAKTPKVVFI